MKKSIRFFFLVLKAAGNKNEELYSHSKGSD